MKGIIWVKDLDQIQEQTFKIISDYEKAGIGYASVKTSKYVSSILFENDDIWHVKMTTDGAKGCAANVAYIDRRIPADVIQSIIMPTLKSPPFQAYKYIG